MTWIHEVGYVGAGTVFGVMKAVAELKPKQNIVGLVVACETCLRARRPPGDVFKSMSGQTIEVLNTDAEGRLILLRRADLCRALQASGDRHRHAHWRLRCGAGQSHNAGLFSSNDKLADAILAWRRKINDRTLAHAAGRGGLPGGAQLRTLPMATWLVAGAALSPPPASAAFRKKYDWAHLDIAGVAYSGPAGKGATGRPVAALVDRDGQRK